METPLHVAARNGDVEEARRLLAGGANVNAVNANRKLPVEVAMDNDQAAMVALLYTDPNNRVGDLLADAAYRGKVPIVNALLDVGANPNGETNEIPLIMAAIGKSKLTNVIAVIDTLLSRGADVNYQWNNNETALMQLIDRNKHVPLPNILQILRHLLEQPNMDINIETRGGKTALMYAAQTDDPAIVSLLLDYEPDPTITYRDGASAVKFAGPNTRHMLEDYAANYPKLIRQAKENMLKRTMLQRRMTTGFKFPAELQIEQKQIPQYIFARAAYDSLCTQLNAKNTRAQLQELARSIGITPGNKSKKMLCTEISKKVVL
jgi:ankyrin repeat protein